MVGIPAIKKKLTGGGKKSSSDSSSDTPVSSDPSRRYIWKPQPSNPNKGPVVLVPTDDSSVPTITTADGQVITGRFVNDLEGAKQYEFPKSLISQSNLNLKVGNQTTTIGNGAQSYEGATLNNFAARAKGSVGAPTASGMGGLYGGQQLGYGIAPADLNALFPDAEKTKLAKFKYTDPIKFAKKYAESTNNQSIKNYSYANDLSLKELDTELKGLQAFVPAASALKRSEIAKDNRFNQSERTSQVDTAMPGVRSALATQTSDAQAYASGRAPDSVTDNALGLNARSRAADQSFVGGFGASSSVARKSSDLMEASDRIKLSQYGNQLLGQNVQTRSNLELAPTEYSNAGSQFSSAPSISGSQLAASNLSQLNGQNIVSANTALATEVSQRSFDTNRRQAVRDTNTQIENNFNMSKFGYQVGYAGAVAGAGQTDLNTQVGLQQQQQYMQTMQQYMQQSQNAGTVGSITSGISSIFGQAGGLSGITKSLGSLGGKGGTGLGGDAGLSGANSAATATSFGGQAGINADNSYTEFSNYEVPDFSYVPQ